MTTGQVLRPADAADASDAVAALAADAAAGVVAIWEGAGIIGAGGVIWVCDCVVAGRCGPRCASLDFGGTSRLTGGRFTIVTPMTVSPVGGLLLLLDRFLTGEVRPLEGGAAEPSPGPCRRAVPCWTEASVIPA